MKNKKLMYALLAASVLVWGWVFLKIFKVVLGNDEVPVAVIKKKISTESTEQKDTFELLTNYRDPFLKGKRMSSPIYYQSAVNSGRTANTIVKKKEIIKTVKVEKVIDWSFIKYKGRITRQSTGKMLSLINIGGGDYSLEEGKEAQQVLLVKSYPDSIQVKFDGVKTYIKRNIN